MRSLVGTILGVLIAAGLAHAAPNVKSGTKSRTSTSASAAKSKSTTKSPAPAAAATRPGGGPRKLEDIHIEGEIPVPQVLFITARDQRRFLDFHHRRYLRTSRELGEATTLPSRVVILPGTATSGEAPR